MHDPKLSPAISPGHAAGTVWPFWRRIISTSWFSGMTPVPGEVCLFRAKSLRAAGTWLPWCSYVACGPHRARRQSPRQTDRRRCQLAATHTARRLESSVRLNGWISGSRGRRVGWCAWGRWEGGADRALELVRGHRLESQQRLLHRLADHFTVHREVIGIHGEPALPTRRRVSGPTAAPVRGYDGVRWCP